MPKITVTNLLTGPFEIADPSGLPGADGTVFTLHLDESGHAGGTDTKSKSATKEQLERLAPALAAAQTASKITWKWEDDTTDVGDDERDAVRVGTASPIVMTVKDKVIICKKSPAGATAVTLPPNPPVGMVVEVIDGNGDAGANNITVSPAAGTINGGANLVINTNFGSATFERYATEWLGKASTVISSGAAGGDLSGTYPNPSVAKVAGVAQTADMVVQKASKTIANAALKTLNATPVEVIAAPGAGSFIELISVHAKIIFATAAFDGVDATDYLELRNTNAAGELLTQNVSPVGFADQGTDQQRLIPLAGGAAHLVTPKDNANVVAHIAGSEWYTAAGGGALHLEVLYRVRTTAI